MNALALLSSRQRYDIREELKARIDLVLARVVSTMAAESNDVKLSVYSELRAQLMQQIDQIFQPYPTDATLELQSTELGEK